MLFLIEQTNITTGPRFLHLFYLHCRPANGKPFKPHPTDPTYPAACDKT